jgi:hypothetical protein
MNIQMRNIEYQTVMQEVVQESLKRVSHVLCESVGFCFLKVEKVL